MSIKPCPGCGLRTGTLEGPTHAYFRASPGCWALYGEMLAREFQDYGAYADLHQVTVDAYAVQHPGEPERRSIQSVAIHLMTLSLVLEHGVDPRKGSQLHRRMVERPSFRWLEPPEPNGTITVADVHRAHDEAEHRGAVDAWARDVWQAWSPHHHVVERWLAEVLRP